MVSKLVITIRTIIGIAFGAACSSAVQFITVSDHKISHIDWHQMGDAASVGAFVAVLMHFMPPPTTTK